jgi:hypothetical protein
VIGRISLNLKLNQRNVELFGTNTERTYAWPGEDIIEKVVQESLSQINERLLTELADLGGYNKDN